MEVLKASTLAGSLMQSDWWSFDGGLMEDTWKIDVGFIEVLKAPVSTLSGSLMQSNWWSFDGGSLEDTWRFDASFYGYSM